MWRPSSFTRFWICSAAMTWRSDSAFSLFIKWRPSTLALLLDQTAVPPTLHRVLLNCPRHFSNQHRFLPLVGVQSGGNRKAAHPHNLISAQYDRPKPALGLLHMPLLQQLLDLLGRLRVRRPKPVSRTPVPHSHSLRQQLGTEKLLRIILCKPRLRSNPQRFDYHTQFWHKHPSRHRQRIFVVRDPLPLPQVRRNEHYGLRLADQLPPQGKRQLFARWTVLGREPQDFLDVLELQRNPRLLTDRLQHSSLHSARLGQQPRPAHGGIHHRRT